MGSGRYLRQLEGYRAFIPAPLPPDPPVAMDPELVRPLSDADRALGRLDGATSTFFEQPIITVRLVERQLHCAYATAGKLVDQLVELGLLSETTGGQRNRVFHYEPYLALFEPPSLLEAASAPESAAIETTGADELPA